MVNSNSTIVWTLIIIVQLLHCNKNITLNNTINLYDLQFNSTTIYQQNITYVVLPTNTSNHISYIQQIIQNDWQILIENARAIQRYILY